MRKLVLLLYLSIGNCSILLSQDFSSQIKQTADTLSKKIISSGKKRIAVIDFINNDKTVNQLGSFLSEELSADLANLSQNQTKYSILERSNLELIFKEKKLIKSLDGPLFARQLGQIDAADLLVYAIVTDFDGYYRVVIKLLDTKGGDALSSYKVNFVKSPSLERLYNLPVLEKKTQDDINSSTAKKDTLKTIPPPSLLKPDRVEPPKLVDVCFQNDNVLRLGAWVAEIKLTSTKSSNSKNPIDVQPSERGCIYEVSPGIYRVDIRWKYNGGYCFGCDRTMEIRVVEGENPIIHIKE